ncbi:MAG: DUF5615 family PIN-like protein [Bryobacterales bacterium]|nr:DUF5615 family PIN-like protein [Bryobacterales bacterium]
MRLLLDECLDHRLRLHFLGHDCISAKYAGLAGLKNGRLLDAAEAAGFAVLITADQEILHQQDLRHRFISILVLCGPTNRRADLERLIPAALRALAVIEPGTVVEVRA